MCTLLQDLQCKCVQCSVKALVREKCDYAESDTAADVLGQVPVEKVFSCIRIVYPFCLSVRYYGKLCNYGKTKT